MLGFSSTQAPARTLSKSLMSLCLHHVMSKMEAMVIVHNATLATVLLQGIDEFLDVRPLGLVSSTFQELKILVLLYY